MSKLVKVWNNETVTQNGAKAYKSTSNANLDMYANCAALRISNQYDRALNYFIAAYRENKTLALRNAFHLRDIREGKGERKMFRGMLQWLYENDLKAFNAVIEYVPFFGRWDDILDFTNSVEVRSIVRKQLLEDITSDHPSLLAKWMPSENTSNAGTRLLATEWMRILDYSARNYRKMLVTLRKKIGVVEVLMSSGKWSDITYPSVPSKAMKQYRKAYGKRDNDRFVAYLENVKNGTQKINTMGLMPYELIKNANDPVIEAQWNNLPDYVGDKSFIPMPDVSGSMSGTPMEVSVSLAIYGAERNKSAFKDLVLSFTNTPTFHKLSGTLFQKYREVTRHVGYDTNLQAAFQAILNLAVENSVPVEDMPNYLLVISDMEFNDPNIDGLTNLEATRKMFAKHGYAMPVIVFWNVDSKQAQVQALDTSKNCILVSGLSAAVFKGALAGNPLDQVTPMEAMLEVLDSERYSMIGV